MELGVSARQVDQIGLRQPFVSHRAEADDLGGLREPGDVLAIDEGKRLIVGHGHASDGSHGLRGLSGGGRGATADAKQMIQVDVLLHGVGYAIDPLFELEIRIERQPEVSRGHL